MQRIQPRTNTDERGWLLERQSSSPPPTAFTAAPRRHHSPHTLPSTASFASCASCGAVGGSPAFHRGGGLCRGSHRRFGKQFFQTLSPTSSLRRMTCSPGTPAPVPIFLREGYWSPSTTTLFAIRASGQRRGFLPLAVFRPRMVTFSHHLYGKGRSAGSASAAPSGSSKRYMPS